MAGFNSIGTKLLTGELYSQLNGVTSGNFVISSPVTVSTNLTIDAGVSIRCEMGGVIACTADLIINGSFTAGLYQCFAGGGSVAFGAGAVTEVYPEWFGARGDGDTDSTTAVQTAITVGVNCNIGIKCSGKYKLTASINIDRPELAGNSDKYFTITSDTGGGFLVSTAIPMFSSSIVFTTDPVSQLIRFQNIIFESTDSSLSAYVLDDGRYMRTVFDGCDFLSIKMVNVSVGRLQSVHLIGGNVRRFDGTFISSTVDNYDVRVADVIVEAFTGVAIQLINPFGCAITNSVIEATNQTAIKYNGARGLTISHCYFEDNAIDIDGTGASNNYGVVIEGNYFSPHSLTTYSVKWGTIFGGVSNGNSHKGYMHDLTLATVQDLIINDFADGSLMTGNTPALKASFDGTYTATLTGCTTSPTGAIRYSKNGSAVTLFIPTITGMSNSTGATLTGLPAFLLPKRQQSLLIRFENNSNVGTSCGMIILDNDGTFILTTDLYGNGFASSNTKGIQQTTVTYSLL